MISPPMQGSDELITGGNHHYLLLSYAMDLQRAKRY